jgi:hypothetical protein
MVHSCGTTPVALPPDISLDIGCIARRNIWFSHEKARTYITCTYVNTQHLRAERQTFWGDRMQERKLYACEEGLQPFALLFIRTKHH